MGGIKLTRGVFSNLPFQRSINQPNQQINKTTLAAAKSTYSIDQNDLISSHCNIRCSNIPGGGLHNRDIADKETNPERKK
jgi:hypothetical protein